MRPRFTLKGLLIVVGVVSVCLGGLRWLLTHDWTLVEEIALPKGRAVKIRTELMWEVGQPYYAEVWDSGRLVSRCYLFAAAGGKARTARPELAFEVSTAAEGELIGLTERRAPNVLLMAHDFRNGSSWPNAGGFERWRQVALRGARWTAELSAACGRELTLRNSFDGRGPESRSGDD